MYFDWITWSIWLLGLIILIIWTWLPIKEFRELLSAHREAQRAANEKQVDETDRFA